MLLEESYTRTKTPVILAWTLHRIGALSFNRFLLRLLCPDLKHHPPRHPLFIDAEALTDLLHDLQEGYVSKHTRPLIHSILRHIVNSFAVLSETTIEAAILNRCIVDHASASSKSALSLYHLVLTLCVDAKDHTPIQQWLSEQLHASLIDPDDTHVDSAHASLVASHLHQSLPRVTLLAVIILTSIMCVAP
jgi:hypothetical protein